MALKASRLLELGLRLSLNYVTRPPTKFWESKHIMKVMEQNKMHVFGFCDILLGDKKIHTPVP